MVLRRVADRVYAETDGSNAGNLGAIVLEDEVVFVDSGMYHQVTRKARDELVATENLPVRRLLITHYHSDHTWGAQGLGQVTMICSHETKRVYQEAIRSSWSRKQITEWAASERDTRPLLLAAVPTLAYRLPDITFEGTLRLGAGSEISFKEVGGHTAGSCTVVLGPDDVIFTGDLIFNGQFPYAGDSTADPDRWISALEEIQHHDYDLIIPGHGEICTSDTVREVMQFLQALRENVRTAVEDELTPEDFISRNLMPDYHKDPAGHRTKTTLERWFQYYRK